MGSAPHSHLSTWRNWRRATVLKDVMTTTLTIQASTKCVRSSNTSLRQLELLLHETSWTERNCQRIHRNRNSEVIDIKINFIFYTHRWGANLIFQWTQLKYDIFIIGKSFSRNSFKQIRFITLHDIYSAWQCHSLPKTFVDVKSRENLSWRNGTIVTISSVSPHC